MLWPFTDSSVLTVTDTRKLTHRVCHLQSRIHQAEDLITVTGLQTNNVVNDIIHLQSDTKAEVQLTLLTQNVKAQPVYNETAHTSFSQLELRVSKAIGLLGALLPSPGGMPPWSEDWLGQGKLNAWEPSFPRYRFTCCCCERWMWYLVGFSKWVWTCWSKAENIILRKHNTLRLGWHLMSRRRSTKEQFYLNIWVVAKLFLIKVKHVSWIAIYVPLDFVWWNLKLLLWASDVKMSG